MKLFKQIIFIVIVIAVSSTQDFVKVIHNTDPEAKCLDGSGAMVYLH